MSRDDLMGLEMAAFSLASLGIIFIAIGEV